MKTNTCPRPKAIPAIHLRWIPNILVISILLGTCAVNVADAQRRRTSSPYRLQQSKAKQALMHTSDARGTNRAARIPSGYRPAHTRLTGGEVFQGEEIIENAGEMIYDDGGYDNPIVDDGGYGFEDSWDDSAVYDDCGGGCDSDCGCASCMGGQTPMLNTIAGINLNNATIFAGTQAFRGPSNLGSTGSFGFHEGFNYGMPLTLFPNSGLGFQVGTRLIQSNLNGADFTTAQRNQSFVTLGAFRRCDYGIQAGLAVDILRDNWYDAVDLTQLRGQISWLFPNQHEWGYWFTAAGSDDTSISPTDGTTLNWSPTSLHAFFYRRRMSLVPGGALTLFAGFSGENDGLVGTKAYLPITGALAFQSDFTYLTPTEGTPTGGTENEGWNLGLSLVWRLGLDSQCTNPSYYQPMFEVADNGNFMVDQK